MRSVTFTDSSYRARAAKRRARSWYLCYCVRHLDLRGCSWVFAETAFSGQRKDDHKQSDKCGEKMEDGFVIAIVYSLETMYLSVGRSDG